MVTAPEAPIMTRRFAGGREAIARIVEDVLSKDPQAPFGEAPLTRELLSLALSEVLYTVTDIAGPQSEGDASSIDLWISEHLLAIAVRFRGARVPTWLLTNWDRGREPKILAPRTEYGWGWLLVREAFDAVSLDWLGS